MTKKKWRANVLRSTLSAGMRTIGLSTLIMLCVATVRADTVLDWNTIALQTTASAPFNPPLESRNLAIVHAAMFDAVNSIVGEFHPYSVELSAANGASPDAAAAAAAHFVLVQFYPARKVILDANYSISLSGIPDGSAKTDGMAVGEAVAAKILAMRANDGAAAAIIAPHTPGSLPGEWVPTPPAFRPALDPGWGQVQPFFLREGSQFRPGPPPTLTSERYTRDFNEVKEIGSATAARGRRIRPIWRIFGYRQRHRSGIPSRDKSRCS